MLRLASRYVSCPALGTVLSDAGVVTTGVAGGLGIVIVVPSPGVVGSGMCGRGMFATG